MRSLGKVRTNVQGYQKSVQASAQEQASVVYNSATRFSTGEATCTSPSSSLPTSILTIRSTVRTDASTSRAMFDSTFTHLVDTTRDTYSMCQQSVLEVGEEIRGTSTSAIDLVRTLPPPPLPLTNARTGINTRRRILRIRPTIPREPQ